MALRHYVSAALSAATLAIPFAVAQAAPPPPPPPPQVARVTVAGEGVVHAVPDLAELRSAVVTTAADAGVALSQNSAAVRTTLAAFRAAGIADADIATTAFTVSPRYAAQKDGDDTPPRITGYTVRNAVTVKIRDLSRLGAVLQAAVGHGANEVGALSFTFADPAKLQDEARRKAMADARHRAALYAAAAGMALGPIMRITDQGGGIPRPFAVMRMAAPAKVPISPGESEIDARVETVWSLRPH